MPNIKPNPVLQNDDEEQKVQFRHAQTEDIPVIAEIYSHARSLMAATGNPHQWVNGHPQQSLIVDDIKKKSVMSVKLTAGSRRCLYCCGRGTPTMTGFLMASG